MSWLKELILETGQSYSTPINSSVLPEANRKESAVWPAGQMDLTEGCSRAGLSDLGAWLSLELG